MANVDEKIERAKTKLEQLKAMKQKIEARKRAVESKKRRTEDTRRKILIGAAILARVESGEWPRESMLRMMDKTLTRVDDRALFELATVTPTPE